MPIAGTAGITYTARVLSGSEAVELGLATHLSDTPREAAYELALEIAGRSPNAVRAAKRLLDTAPVVSPQAGLELEAELQRQIIGKPNQIEAVMANLQKREPDFEDPV